MWMLWTMEDGWMHAWDGRWMKRDLYDYYVRWGMHGHGHGKQILKGDQKKLASPCLNSPPPAQDMLSSTWFPTQTKLNKKGHHCWPHLYLFWGFSWAPLVSPSLSLSTPIFPLLLSFDFLPFTIHFLITICKDI